MLLFPNRSAGANYLMRCLLRLKDGKYVYVGQVRNGLPAPC